MKSGWIKIVIAAIFELFWVIGLKHADTSIEWIGTLIAIFLSFYFLISATKQLPVGTAYAVFVGLGTTGTILADTLLFRVPLPPTKIFFIVLLMLSVIGLKLLSSEPHGEEDKIR